MDKKHKSLSAQAAQLQRSIQSREERRIAEKAQRYEAAEAAGEYGAYDAPPAKRAAPGGTGRNAAVAKLSEISALASRPVETFRCDLCNANFPSQAQYQQHLAGPVHRKALDRLAEQQLAAQRRAVYQDMTESALGAAAWGSGHGSGPAAGGGGGGSRQQGSGPGGGIGASGVRAHAMDGGGGTASAASGSSGGRGGAGGRGGGRWQGVGGRNASPIVQSSGAALARPRHDAMSHEERVAAATRADEPLTIGGWAPPTVILPAPKQPVPEKSPPGQEHAGAVEAELQRGQQQRRHQQRRQTPEEGREGQPPGGRSSHDDRKQGAELRTTGGRRQDCSAGDARALRGGSGAGSACGGLLGLAYGSDDEDADDNGGDGDGGSKVEKDGGVGRREGGLQPWGDGSGPLGTPAPEPLRQEGVAAGGAAGDFRGGGEGKPMGEGGYSHGGGSVAVEDSDGGSSSEDADGDAPRFTGSFF